MLQKCVMLCLRWEHHYPFHRMPLRVNGCGLSHSLQMLGCVNGICILSEANILRTQDHIF